MVRTKLGDRRFSVNLPVEVSIDGQVHKLQLTVGFDENRRARELFCASFKAGTGLNVLVMDTCVLTSKLLQHGYTAREIFETLADGPSLIGQLVRAAVLLEEGDPPVAIMERKGDAT